MTWTEKAQQLRDKIENAAIHLSDEEALLSIELFPKWKSDIEYEIGYRVQDEAVLYKCRQTHTSQSDWRPAVTPSLWEVVSIEDGTHDHPIHYTLGMIIESGKFYLEDEVLYECIRDSVVPIYNKLADLIGNYVRVSNNI